MSVVLSVYSENAYKEFVLPSVINTETVLFLRREIFGLSTDMELTLENNDGAWSFTRETLRTLVGSDSGPSGVLQNGDYFRVQQNGRVILAIMVSISETRFVSSEKYALTGESVTVGTDQDCGIRYSFEYRGAQYITHQHAVISRSGSGLTLTDRSRNGVFINDTRIHGTVNLRFGDQIDIWGLSMVALGQVLAIRPCPGLRINGEKLRPSDLPCLEKRTPAEKIHYHRSPRSQEKLHTGKIAIEAPPAPQKAVEQPLYMVIGPSLTMALPMLMGSAMAVIGSSSGGAFMYTGIITAVMSAVIGTMWALLNIRFSRSQQKKNENHRFSAYSDYLVRTAEEVRNKYEHNSQVLRSTYPSASELVEAGLRGEHLWERNINHPDFLTYRLGLGDRPFQVEISVPNERFDLVEDSLKEKPAFIRDNFSVLHNVPVCIDLRRERIVGLVGGPARTGAMALARSLTAQVAVENCYTDVKLAFVFHEDHGDDPRKWAFARWLPHVWSESRRTRYVASSKAEASDVFYELAAVLRNRAEQKSGNDDGAALYKPWYILVLEDSAVLENEPIAKFILDPRQDLGITTVILADRADDLPNSCECVVCLDNGSAELYNTREGRGETGQIEADVVDPAKLEELSRSLANVEVSETEVGGEIPRSVSFFEMYGIERPEELLAEERWKKNRTYENMRALIGQKSGNQPCYLDVHEKYHGPHGLVAGTTGSGKSETLQTYVLSLAANFSPYDVGLFIIDYKGGGMGNLFNGLPHVLGQISNLSGNQIRRAMASIKSENMRRQRIFNENGVNNINLYTSLVKNGEASEPVPHLFIIIDEFAELKREQPDFMRELISVAQVGRSLGVHLILATQKPGGTVDENIWSNSKFRLCLRVQDRQDSMDMLHKPDAAYLTGAGRGYLQVGNDEVFEQFQSGWSGAVYDEDDVGGKQVLAKMLTDSGKTALVGSYAKRHRKEDLQLRWIGTLTSCVDDPGGADISAVRNEAYRQIRAMEIDYSESDYNTRLLENLIRLLREARAASVPEEKLSAWVVERARQGNIKLPERREKTQLDAMVEYLARTAQEQGFKSLRPLWMAPLPTLLTLAEVSKERCAFDGASWPVYEAKWELEAMVGLCDDPAQQAQFPVTLNFNAGGNHALIGAVGSGKSTFTQTLIYSLLSSYSPAYLNLYVLDFSSRMTSPFERAPHVGGILYESDLEKVGKLFYLLGGLLEERKRLFRGGSYTQYVMVNGVVCPTVLLIIDNMANFREKTQEAFDEELARLAREGAGYGIYMFVTGMGFGMSQIPGRIGDNLRTTLSLELSDMYQYADALRTATPSVLPESGVQGRGLVEVDGTVLEFQTAISLPADDDYQRVEKLAAVSESMRDAWTGPQARAIPFIPEKPTWADLEARGELPALLSDPKYLPVGYDGETAGVYSLDLSRTYCYTVAGRRRTGKTSVLRLLLRSASLKGMKLAVIECSGSALKNDAATVGAEYVAGFDGVKDFVARIAQIFRARNAIKKQCVESGADEEQLFARMSQEEPWLVVISDLSEFARLVHSAKGMEVNLNGALANLLGRGFLFNIYFAAGLDVDDHALGLEIFELFIKEKSGMYLGGNVASQQIFDFTGMPFKDQTVPEKPGVGLVPPKDGEPYRRVILPMVKS